MLLVAGGRMALTVSSDLEQYYHCELPFYMQTCGFFIVWTILFSGLQNSIEGNHHTHPFATCNGWVHTSQPST
jgi:hypothetical protein